MVDLVRSLTDWRHWVIACFIAVVVSLSMVIIAEQVSGHAKNIALNAEKIDRIEVILVRHLEDCKRNKGG